MARSSPAVQAAAIALFVHLVVGLPLYLWAFMSSYFMNDLPGAHANLSFLRWGVISAVLSAGAVVLLSARNPGVSRREVLFAVGTSTAVNGVWLAFFFGSDVDNLGDDSGTMYDAMSRGTVETIATGCAVAAVIGLVIAVVSRPRGARA